MSLIARHSFKPMLRPPVKAGLPGRDCRARNAFTLIELLVVIAIMAMMIAASGPAFRALRGVDQAGSDLSAALSLARVYAMSNHTYVRVGFAQTAAAIGQSPSTVVVFLYSADGDIDLVANSDLESTSEWPAFARALIFKNLLLYSSINGTLPSTTGDSDPTQSNMVQFNRKVPIGSGSSSILNFTACIQFDPDGEARVNTTTTARYIKIPLDQPQSPNNIQTPRGQDPCIVRISGVNGSMDILRKGAGI